eukprot:353811-Chlamydomonas_euryale.AAC.3
MKLCVSGKHNGREAWLVWRVLSVGWGAGGGRRVEQIEEHEEHGRGTWKVLDGNRRPGKVLDGDRRCGKCLAAGTLVRSSRGRCGCMALFWRSMQRSEPRASLRGHQSTQKCARHCDGIMAP